MEDETILSGLLGVEFFFSLPNGNMNKNMIV